MNFAVTDANIFIDLFALDLLPYLFRLEITLYTSLEVYGELEAEEQHALDVHISEGDLKLLSTEDLSLDGFANNNMYSNQLSYADLSVLFHAKKLSIGVITGDNTMRKICHREGREVHGILWLMHQMVLKKQVRPNHAMQQLDTLMMFNKRLPEHTCRHYYETWQDMGE